MKCLLSSTELQWHHWNQQDLTALIMAAVDHREKLAHTLAKAFYIFDPVSMKDFNHFMHDWILSPFLNIFLPFKSYVLNYLQQFF